ncbi:nucleotide modification associated domain-containing protein [uncultured Anaerococcus sp.]|uniref:nucleotide modification associated domain-containing protein n=1 Tax=uncultured Anaerococcus sp. TaxID=293428 RepID=UPI0025CCAC7E|nr:nucleotide modification associated domain-containing protein [uncultured Anaerococcus sp.]
MTEKVDIRAEKLEEIMNNCLNLYKKKNADYGNSFAEVYQELGFESGLVQILHKINRIKGIYKNNKAEVENESIRDSLIDLANYSLMTAVEMEIEDKQEDFKSKVSMLGLAVKVEDGKTWIGVKEGYWNIAEIEKVNQGAFKLLSDYWLLEEDKAKELWKIIIEHLILDKDKQ